MLRVWSRGKLENNLPVRAFDALTNIVDAEKSMEKGVKFNELKDIKKLKYYIFVWSTCSGKSSIINYIRDQIAKNKDVGLQEAQYTYIPERYITRPPRKGNNIDRENIHVTHELLDTLKDDGGVGISWIRNMELNPDGSRRKEEYGYKSAETMRKEIKRQYQILKSFDQDMPSIPQYPTDDKAVIIYSWNNAFFDNPESIKEFDKIKDEAIVIWVYCPDEIREQRLRARNPELFKTNPEEVAYRLGDSSENILPHCHLVINNYGDNEKLVFDDALDLVEHSYEYNKK